MLLKAIFISRNSAGKKTWMDQSAYFYKKMKYFRRVNCYYLCDILLCCL